MSNAVRDALRSDLPRIVEIYNAAVKSRIATADLAPVTVESRERWFEGHSSTRFPLWVYEEGSRVVAWIGVQQFRERAAYSRSAEFSLFVDTGFQHRGIGELLLRRMIERCPSLGIDVLVGLIFAHNKPSLSLARKAGFRRWGYLYGVTEIDGIKRDVAIFGLRVNAKVKARI